MAEDKGRSSEWTPNPSEKLSSEAYIPKNPDSTTATVSYGVKCIPDSEKPLEKVKNEVNQLDGLPTHTSGPSCDGASEVLDPQSIAAASSIEECPAYPDVLKEPPVFGAAQLPATPVEEGKIPIPRPRIKILIWNVLANSLMYGYLLVPHEHQLLSYRRPRLESLIIMLDADLIVLVEIDKTCMYDHLMELLRPLGYDGDWKKKDGNDHEDGIAIIFKTSVLDNLTTDLANHQDKASGQEEVKIEQPGKFISRNFVGEVNGKPGVTQIQFYMLAKFRLKRADRDFILCATHLKAYPQFESARVEQVKMILKELESFNGLPIFFAGDLNSIPDQAVYKEIERSPLKFQDVFKNRSHEPRFTTFAYRLTKKMKLLFMQFRESQIFLLLFMPCFKRWWIELCEVNKCNHDYIWTTGSTTVATQMYPDVREIGDSALPNATHSSDHFALMIEEELNG